MRKNILFFGVFFAATAAVLAFFVYLFSRNLDLKTKSEILQHVGVAAAALMGGLWASYRFLIQRGYETALQIDFDLSYCAHRNGSHLVFADATLSNKGQTRINAKPKNYVRDEALPTYTDAAEVLYHSCALQLKRIDQHIASNAVLDWFESAYLQQVDGIPKQINLLYEYEVSKNGAIDFWIEPNESYHCSIPLLLTDGDYVAKVYFIGNRGGFEFWSRTFLFRLDESDTVGRLALSPIDFRILHQPNEVE